MKNLMATLDRITVHQQGIEKLAVVVSLLWSGLHQEQAEVAGEWLSMKQAGRLVSITPRRPFVQQSRHRPKREQLHSESSTGEDRFLPGHSFSGGPTL